jgi:hypothetical protein
MAPAPPVVALAKAMLADEVEKEAICLRFVRLLYGHDGVRRVAALNFSPANHRDPFAAEAWQNAQIKHQPRTGVQPKAPPAGVPVWWTGGASGHVAISAGGGYVISTDYPRPLQVNKVGIKDLTEAWRKTYRGWTEDINDVTVYVTHEVRLSKLQAAAESQVDDGAAPKACLIVNASLYAAGLLGDRHAMDEHLSAKSVHAYRKWQAKLGVTGTGVPDKRSLTRLGKKYGFTVV